MHNVLTALVLMIVFMILIELSQRPPLETRDISVWTDDVERRLIAGLRPQDRR